MAHDALEVEVFLVLDGALHVRPETEYAYVRFVVLRAHVVGHDVVGHLRRGHQVHLEQAASLRTSSRNGVLHADVGCAACRRRLCCMKTSVTTSSDALARKGAATARVRSGANGGTNGARSDVTRRATRKGSRAQKRRGRKGGARGASKGGGRALAPQRRRVQGKPQRAARVDAHDDGEQEAPVGGLTFWQ